MYSVTFYYVPSYNYSNLESALYNSLHRLGWSLFTGWMVLACVTSESSALKSFLSSRALVPLSRLTYCAYLTNGFIELYLAASIRTPKFMSVTNLVITTTLINDQNVKLISLFLFFVVAARGNALPRLSDVSGCAHPMLDVWVANPRHGENATATQCTGPKSAVNAQQRKRIRRI